MRIKAILTRCKKKDLNPKSISDKVKELGNQEITQKLNDALGREFAQLGCTDIKAKLEEKVEKGRMRHH
jgi:hypothetical protein